MHKYPFLIFTTRIAENNLHEKSIEFSFRKRVCPLMFERILCRKYDKWLRKFESLITDSHLFFFHGFEKCRLYLRGSAIDLICKKNTRKNRSFANLEFSFLDSVDLVPSQIGREKIRGEWDSLGIEGKDSRERPNRLGLTKSRNSLEKRVSSCKYRDNELVYECILTDNLLLDLCTKIDENISDVIESWIQNSEKLRVKSKCHCHFDWNLAVWRNLMSKNSPIMRRIIRFSAVL